MTKRPRASAQKYTIERSAPPRRPLSSCCPAVLLLLLHCPTRRVSIAAKCLIGRSQLTGPQQGVCAPGRPELHIVDGRCSRRWPISVFACLPGLFLLMLCFPVWLAGLTGWARLALAGPEPASALIPPSTHAPLTTHYHKHTRARALLIHTHPQRYPSSSLPSPRPGEQADALADRWAAGRRTAKG